MMLRLPSLLAALILAAACGSSGPEPDGTVLPAPVDARGISLDAADYPVFPRPDEGADPSVPAEQGGAGFTGEGWETNLDFGLIGDPRAVKGGTLREYYPAFPGTLRMEGPESNTDLNVLIGGLVYETLLSVHPTTLEFIPALATHWQISDDRLSYRFRINPNARFSDGTPVTAEDVVATFRFNRDPGLQAPMAAIVWNKFEEPVAETPYIVSVNSSQLNWRNFLYFAASLPILPAHVLEKVDGETYLRDYNFKLLPGSGPYIVNEADVDKGNSITIRRRDDYWAVDHRRNVGTGNFDEIREIVVRDENLAFEMFKRGDLDYFFVTRSRTWVEEMNFDTVQRGLIQKRKIFNNYPAGIQGLAFNMRKAPFDDINVRKALTLLLNRELLIEKLFYNEYEPQNTYYPNSVYENPNNPLNEYDRGEALRLLGESGWTERDAQGRLTRNGQPLTVEVLYGNPGSEPFLTIYQEDLRNAGIAMNLRLVTPETLFQLVMERRFDVVHLAWGGIAFPNPETSYHSSLADVDNTNNITGIKDPRIDAICDAYDAMFDVDERIAAIRELDGILAEHQPYVLQWYAPSHRIAYWNKFGHPDGYLTKMGDYRDIPSLWWFDPAREEQLTLARGDGSVRLETGETESRYWANAN